jgi:hypothetical protein
VEGKVWLGVMREPVEANALKKVVIYRRANHKRKEGKRDQEKTLKVKKEQEI